MSFNLEIMVLGQEKAEKIPYGTTITVRHETEIEGRNPRNTNIWDFMAFQKGSLYSIGIIEEDNNFWALKLLDTDFDKIVNQKSYNWIGDEYVLENITPLRIHNEYFEDFKKILEYLINLSPLGMIMIFARYQGVDKEIIQGIIPFKKYIEMLQNDEIPFNVCSIIRK